MRLIDFSNCEIDKHSDYGGSDRKRAVFYDGERYMLKFSERHEKTNDYGTSHVNNVLSEYIGSHIMESAGLPVHDTLIGTYNGELVVACKNFLQRGETLHEFSWYMRTQYDSADVLRSPKIEQIYSVISSDPDLSSLKNQALDRYWDTFVIDALIGNFDRHSGNWGYIVGTDDRVRLAPIYDCGSSLYPNLSSDAMSQVLESEYGIARRMYEFPKAALLINQEKAGYYDLMASGYNADCSNAVLRMAPKIDIDAIKEIIKDIPILSDTRKAFYTDVIDKRNEFILRRAYERVACDNYDTVALGRIGEPSFKDEKETMEEYHRALNERGIVRIGFPTRYIRQTEDRFSEKSEFIMAYIPDGTIYRGKDMGGCRVCPDEIYPDEGSTAAIFKKDEIKLHDKSGGFEIIKASDLKSAIDDRQKDRDAEKDKSKEKAVLRTKDTEKDFEIE